MMKQTILFLSAFLFLISCKKEKIKESLPPQTEISQKIDELYKLYGNSNDALYNQPFSDRLFSPELKKALEGAVNASKADMEKVKKSDHPDEKPLLFEVSVFSSLYEGFSGYKIKSVKINPSGTSADAFVELEYTMNPPTIKWTDTVHVINSGQGWKIDNISCDSIGNSKDLKSSLKDFTQNAQ